MVEGKDRKIPQEDRVIVILGPTASGKTHRAVSIAKMLDGEIVSADSRQVYKNMDIGTGKDLNEYCQIKYHLIDICEAGEKYNLHRYIKDFHAAVEDIRARAKRIIVCGGSGMYLENALSGIRLPEVSENYELRKILETKSLEELTEILKSYKTLHNTTDIDTAKRAVRAIEISEFYRLNPDKAANSDRNSVKQIENLIIGIEIPRDKRRERISIRLEERLGQGMVEEVERLLKSGLSYEDVSYYGLEYKFLADYLTGRISYNKMKEGLEIAIHQFAKRQMTWFRGMERRGFRINWLPYDMSETEFINAVLNLLKEPCN